jgi:hypothetical protein
MAKKMDTTVKLNPVQFKKLKDYEVVLGTSVENAVHEAVSDFIECCVSTRLESSRGKSARRKEKASTARGFPFFYRRVALAIPTREWSGRLDGAMPTPKWAD